MTLLVLTGLSLLAALLFAGALWRLARDERARSRARVVALSTAARDASESTRRTAALADDDWNRRAEVAEASRHDDWTLPSDVGTAPPRSEAPFHALSMEENTATPAASMADSFLRGADRAAPDRRQRSLALATAALLIVIAGAGVWWVTSRSTPLPETNVSNAAPVELVSLRHERLGAKLAVAGLVRNPVSGRSIERLSAVVLLFDQAGTAVTSGQALVDFLSLGPGEESPFVVEVEAPQTITRYRVSFRTEDGVMAHVDRRPQSFVTPASFERPASASRR
ncbi:MAG: hypothetical protein ABR606_16850 [Vicinamibacterales bacterium]